jgi:cholesterol 7-dehydrogenase
MHIQEFAENSVDFAHFQCIHGDMMVPWTTWTLPLLKVQHNAAWSPGTEAEGKRIAHFIDKPMLKIFGRIIPRSGVDADITFVGALCSVPLRCCKLLGLTVHVDARTRVAVVVAVGPGPAGIVFFHFKIPDMGEIILFQTHTPLEPMLLQTNFRYFADENIPRALVSYVVRIA